MSETKTILRRMTEAGGRLPPGYERLRPTWDKCAEACGRALSLRLEAAVEITPPRLALRALDAVVEDCGEDPGVILLLDGGNGPAPFARASRQDAIALASILLKAQDPDEAAAAGTDMVDTLLVGTILRTILSVINDAFETEYSLAGSDALTEWPFDLGTLSPRLLQVPLTMEIVPGEDDTPPQRVALDLHLPADERRFVAGPPPVVTNPRTRALVLDAPATIEAVLHQRPSSLRELSGLSTGMVLPLPGARLDALALRLSGGRVVAGGEHGKTEGHQSVRVSTAIKPRG